MLGEQEREGGEGEGEGREGGGKREVPTSDKRKMGTLAGNVLSLWLFQTRALMCDVYVHNDMAVQRQSLRLIGGRSPGSQDSRRPPVSNTGKTRLMQY